MKKNKTNKTLEDALERMAQKGLIVSRTENNPHLKISYKGADGLITKKWNIKIYKSGTFVCVDPTCIREFVQGNLKEPDESLHLIEIDDAGIGFPLGGCMVGACDGEKVVTDIVPVKFFRQGLFETQNYLQEYAVKGLALIKNAFGATPSTHRIEICTGFINSILKDLLRHQGFSVRVVEIKGMLQDKLESIFIDYVRNLTCGVDLGYDPKDLSKALIAFHYNRAVQWAKKHDPSLLKTGWKSLCTSDQLNLFG